MFSASKFFHGVGGGGRVGRDALVQAFQRSTENRKGLLISDCSAFHSQLCSQIG